MPYARKHHRKFGKRKRARKGVTKAVKRYVKREIRVMPETKYIELNTLTNATVTVAGTCSAFTAFPTQGTTVGGRIGDSITVKNMYFDLILEGSISASLATYNPMNRVRLIVGLVKRQTAGNTGLTVYQVLDTGVANAIQAPYQSDYRDAWTCYYDKTFSLGSILALAGTINLQANSNSFKHIRKTIRINKKQKYINNGGAITGTLENIPFWLLVSDTPAGQVTPLATMYSRMSYSDA